MRQFNRFRGTSDFLSAWLRVLSFWDKHGLEAVHDAYGIPRSTLYRWQKQVRDGNGKLEVLNGNYCTLILQIPDIISCKIDVLPA